MIDEKEPTTEGETMSIETHQILGQASPVWSRPLSDAMTRHVRCVHRNTTLRDVVILLLDKHISGAPVVDDAGRAVGIISKTDVLERLVKEGPDLSASVDRIMTPLTFSLPEDAPIGRAAALMAFESVHRLVITAKGGAVVGILSALDLVRWIARQDHFAVPDNPH